MNFFLRTMILVIFSLSLQIGATNESGDQINRDTILKKIMEKVAEGNDRISGGEEKAILLLGNTGSGKSTLAHLLTGRKLQGILNDHTGDMVVDAVEPLESIRISHNSSSETKIPNKCLHEDLVVSINKCINHQGEVIWDCPGFNDTNLIQEIANSFYIKKLYNQHKKLKFVLVASEGSLADKGTSFVNILQQFCNSFKNVDLVKDSVVLVITGAKTGKRIEHLRNTLTRIQTDNESLSQEARKMLLYLMDKIALFHVPQQEGLLPNYDMFGTIASMGSFANAQSDIGKFSLSSKAVEHCHDLLKMSFSNLKQLIGVLLTAVNDPYACTTSGNNNVLEKNYDAIKPWLPAKVTYTRAYPAQQHHDDERFLKIKLLKDLSSMSQKIQTLDTANFSLVAELAENLYNIIDDYVIIKQNCNKDLKQKIEHFAYAVKQMKEYSNLFASLIEYKFSDDYNLAKLSADLSVTIKNCCDVLARNLKDAVVNLEIDDKNAEIAYHQEAIGLLNLQPDNETCIKKQAKCYNLMGCSKRKGGELDESVRYFIKALKLDKTIHHTYDEMGDILESQGRFKGAITAYQVTENIIKIRECYKNLIQQNPTSSQLREEFGDLYLKLGMHQKAHQCYMEAKCLATESAIIKALLTKMAACLNDETRQKASQACLEKANNGKFYDYDSFDIANFEKQLN